MFNLKEEVSQRVNKAQLEMAKVNLDILFIVGRENLIYFTGNTELECMALIIPQEGDPVGVTLWLDVEYLKENSGLTNITGYVFPRQDLVSRAVEVVKSMGLNRPRIGFEKYFVDFIVYQGLRAAFSEQNFVNATELIYRIRSVKSTYELERIRRASEIVVKGMRAAITAVRPGITELDILAEAEYAMLKAGSSGSPFRPQVVSGERALLTHPTTSTKAIQPNEPVVIHLGASFEGYCSKMCRTIANGTISTEQAKTYELLGEAQDRAFEALRPGVRACKVHEIARAVFEREGLAKYYPDISGYGIGLRQSEFFPLIGVGHEEIIEENMVVDLLLGTLYKKTLGGPRLTDVVQVCYNGVKILTNFTRDLYVLK